MEHSQDLQQVHWLQFIYMDRLNTTHQWSCMTWLGKCSKRHLAYLKKKTTANTQIQKMLLLKYKFASIKRIQQRDIEYTAIYTANTAPKKAICMCIYSHKAICMCIYSHKAICMCIYSHKAICMCVYSNKAIHAQASYYPTSSRKWWAELCGHTLATELHKKSTAYRFSMGHIAERKACNIWKGTNIHTKEKARDIIGLIAFKGPIERYWIHDYHTARTALKKDIGTSAHSLIKPSIHRHNTATTSSTKRWTMRPQTGYTAS